MIQNVRSGQALTAGLLNNIISQANGQDIPSNQNFVNTDKGTLFVNNHDYEVGSEDGEINKFLECYIANAPELEKRPNEYVKNGDSLTMKPYIFINLGSSKTEACNCITVNNNPVKEIVLINENEEQDALLEDDFLKQDGYVQLGKIESDIIVYGQLYDLSKKEDNKNKSLGYVFAVSTVKDNNERVKEQAKKSSDLNSAENISLIAEKTILTTTTIEGVNYKGLVQNVIGSQNLLGTSNFEETPPDSSISNLLMSSIENAVGEYQISTDVETADGTLSTEVKNVKVTYRRLFNFDAEAQDFPNVTDNNAGSASGESEDSIKNYDLVARQISSDGSRRITYLSLNSLSNVIAGISSISAISGDSQIIEDTQKSITLSVDDDKKYYQLYNFDNGESNAELTSTNGVDLKYQQSESDNLETGNIDIVVRARNNDTAEIQYLKLDSLSATTIPTDTEVFKDRNPTQKSIEVYDGYITDDIKYKCLQLYKMNEVSDVDEESKSVVIEYQGQDPENKEKPYTQSLLPEDYEFVVRSVTDGCQDGTIHYMPLSVGVKMTGVDTYDSTGRISRSIEWTDSNSSRDYLYLYNFRNARNVKDYEANYTGEIQADTFKVDESDGILFRKSTKNDPDPENDIPELHYMTFKSMKNYILYQGDTDMSYMADDIEKANISKSIERVTDEKTHIDFFRLKDFTKHKADLTLEGELASDETTRFTDDDTFILVRQFDEDGYPVLRYARLEITLPEINNGTDYSYAINELYGKADYLSGEIYNLSSDLSNAWIRGGTYEENYGSSIGNSYQTKVIDLDCPEFIGTWYQSGGTMNFTNQDSNYGTTTIDGGIVRAEGLNSNYVTVNDELMIGCTTINEEQLQRLLALLN